MRWAYDKVLVLFGGEIPSNPSYLKILEKYFIKSIKELKAKIAEVEKALGELVKKSERLKENFQLMTTIPGIGKLTAYQLLGLISDMDSLKTMSVGSC